MAGYIGSKASVVSSGAERKKTFAITTSTTSLTGLAYTVNQVHVFHNGIRLVDGTDYTATDGTTITLTNAAANGDEVVVVSYAAFQTSDTVSASLGGTFADAVTIDADGAPVLTVDRATSDGTIIDVQRSGTSVGAIGIDNSDNLFLSGNSGHSGIMFGTVSVLPYANGALTDGTEDLGNGDYRFKDLYLSGGVVFDAVSGNATSNTLDDYEEGTWTPVVADAVSGGNTSSTTAISANYIKIGNAVHFNLRFSSIDTTGLTGGNHMYIRGIPFVMTSEEINCSIWFQQVQSLNANVMQVAARISDAHQAIRLEQIRSDNNIDVAFTLNNMADDAFDISVSGTYFTN